MEIERKFLTEEIPFSLEGFACLEIAQSYISFQPTIRIRKKGDAYFLTVKGKGHLAREEFELGISEGEYESLREKTQGAEIAKKRYLIPLEKGLVAELDVYEGDLSGLFTTEVEFSTIGEAESFVPPSWFGADVSLEKAYKNTSLARDGLPFSKQG